MLGLGLDGFNKQYRIDLALLYRTLTQAKNKLKIPEEYKGDIFGKFVAQLINYTLSGNYELNEPIPKSEINVPHEILTNFFQQNPQLILSFLHILVYKDKRLRKLLKDRYIGTKEEIAVADSIRVLSIMWFETGQAIADKNNSAQGKAIYAILTNRNS